MPTRQCDFVDLYSAGPVAFHQRPLRRIRKRHVLLAEHKSRWNLGVGCIGGLVERTSLWMPDKGPKNLVLLFPRNVWIEDGPGIKAGGDSFQTCLGSFRVLLLIPASQPASKDIRRRVRASTSYTHQSRASIGAASSRHTPFGNMNAATYTIRTTPPRNPLSSRRGAEAGHGIRCNSTTIRVLRPRGSLDPRLPASMQLRRRLSHRRRPGRSKCCMQLTGAPGR